MKKIAPLVVLFLFALLAWNVFVHPGDLSDMSVDIDGDTIDGPVGALVGLVFAGGGLLIGGLVMLCVGLVLAVVFAGVGVLLVGALGLGMLIVAAVVAPLLIPLLLPLALICYLAGRGKRRRARDAAV